MMKKNALIALALPVLLSLSVGVCAVQAAESNALQAKKLSRAANAKAVKKAKALATKKSVKKMAADAKKKAGRGYGADEDAAFAICGLTAEMGAQVMIDAAKDVPVSETIQNVKAGELFQALPAEVTSDPDFNKNFEQSVAEMHKEFSTPEYKEEVKDMNPEQLKLGLFVACMAN